MNLWLILILLLFCNNNNGGCGCNNSTDECTRIDNTPCGCSGREESNQDCNSGFTIEPRIPFGPFPGPGTCGCDKD